jgi:DNA-binding SARP family transcriptional activator/predicted ATPase
MQLALSLLGPLHIVLNGRSLTAFSSDKERALLLYLALENGRPHRRETLAGLFWGEQSQELAFNNLRKTLYRLRQTLQQAGGQETTLLLITAKEVQWNPAVSLRLDVAEFKTLTDKSRNHAHRRVESCRLCRNWLDSAVSLYRGHFLENFSAGDSLTFEEWASVYRESLRVEALAALVRLIHFHDSFGEMEQAATYAHRLAALEPWHELAHRTLMRAYNRQGRRAAALAQYGRLQQLLAGELGIAPDEETTHLYRQIKAGQPELTPLFQQTGFLPRPMTTFIGREEELVALTGYLGDPATRLLTLAGPGGAGKTRLAIQAARQVSHDFPDGAWFIPLEKLDEEGGAGPGEAVGRPENNLAAAIADSLSIRFSGSQEPKTQLLNALKACACLLILDNFETVMPAAGLVLEILQNTTQVVFLVTSREPLQFLAERLYRLAGLPVPPEAAENAAAFDSVRLFQERAERVAGRPLPAKTVPQIAAICRFLEGIPLAIELAACWIPRLAPAEILTRLQEQYEALAFTMRDIPARHRTMQAVFDGSWRLLTAGQQTALAQASLFHGGFSGEAAQQIIAAPWPDVVALADKSLLRADPAGRYMLHELLRQFAATRLQESGAGKAAGEGAAAANRHSHYYLAYLEERAAALWGEAPQHTLQELRREWDNIRAAWQGAVARRLFEPLAQSLNGLVTYYARTGLFHEGIEMLRQTIAVVKGDGDEITRSLGGWLQVELARLLAPVADFEAAKAGAQEGLRMGEALEETAMQGWSRFRWARVLWMQGYYEDSRPLLEGALAVAQASGLERLEAECWLALSALTDTQGGNFALARDCGEKALALFHIAGNRLGEIRVLILLGNSGWGVGVYVLARSHYEPALQLCRQVDSRYDEAAALVNLGTVLRELGDYGRAASYYELALRLFHELHDQRRGFVTLTNMSLLQHQMELKEPALRYGQQALAMARELHTRAGESQPLCCLGHALLALNRPEEAAAAYSQSGQLHREAGNNHLAMEPLAGLVRVALAQMNISQAMGYAEEILAHLVQGTLDGTEEPLRVQLTVYQALTAAQDPRAGDVLTAAHQALMARAALIGDAAVRQSFLDNISVHRALQMAMKAG